MFPRQAVGSVVGIGGFFGAIGGAAFSRVTGFVLQHNGENYTPIFLVCGFAYVTALAIVQLLVPRLERARLGQVATDGVPAAGVNSPPRSSSGTA